MGPRILGILGWLGIALVLGGLAVRLLGGSGVMPVSLDMDRYASYAAWTGLVLVVIQALGQLDFKRRTTQYGTMAVTSIVVVLGLLVAVNYLSNRRNTRWDLTENQQYSLSEQTVGLLTDLETPVTFLVFDQAGNFDRFRTRLEEYTYHSPQVSVEYIDADRQPVRAREYAIEAYGTVVIEYMDRTERVTSDTEQDLTNGLIKVLTGEQKTVYFVQGHGERDMADTERTGYSTVAEALGRDNYATESIVLAQRQSVPEDAVVLVIAGPTTDLLQPEADMVARYLDQGGHVLVLLDPLETGDRAMPALEALLRAWAVDAGSNVVVDVSGVGQLLGTDATVPVAASYPQHAVTAGFNLLTAYPMARSIDPGTSDATGRVAQSIIQTGQQSWAETDIATLVDGGEIEMDAGTDRQGPISIGVAVTAPVEAPETPADADASDTTDSDADAADDARRPESRLVAIGDSDFAANYALGISGNRDLFMNAVSWLAQQENLIAIRPREASDRRLTLTAGGTSLLLWISLVFVPAGVMGAGVYTWWRRRAR
jgi:ABC-type uncharacterized transport system involved in gliding motility auxiliary subunit